MTLTIDQGSAVAAAGSVAVLAGAGAGKTHMLAARYVHHLDAHRLRPLEVVAVTFTDKAAGELRARIREDVRDALPGKPDYLAELEAAPISTIHALAARICREHPAEAGVPADFAILDELEGQLWRLGQLDLALDDLPAPAGAPVPFGLLREAVEAFLKDPLAAEAALEKTPADWERTCRAAQREALAAFVADPIVRGTMDMLDMHAGQGPVEEKRQDALRALMAFSIAASGGKADLRCALDTLVAISLRPPGKKADWPAGGLDEVKEALKAARDVAKAAQKVGLIAWEPGEAEARMAAMLPTLRQVSRLVRHRLATAKRRARMLDFADLEVHALRALARAEVRAYYQARWKAFLIDEFQDTNPDQAQLLERLTEGAKVTIVGDEKQAIYGFRRADVAVFRRFAGAIAQQGGAQVDLGTSFRTHAKLVEGINDVFRPVLENLHKDLAAARRDAPHAGPFITAEAVDAPKGALVDPCRRVEAMHVARAVKAQLEAGLMVHDKPTDMLRPLRPGDVAVLARTWAPLDAFVEAFAAVGVPAVHAGGGSLLATREALDAWAMLRVLANPRDSLALAAVLRGPWFAVSDRELLAFAQMAGKRAWWSVMREDAPPALVAAHDALAQLMRARRHESPSRLLQLADRLCGYTGVIANMPGAARREADWAGFVEFVRALEGGGADADMVVKLLARLAEAEVEVPRPPLEAGNAVALMTIHAAKGLEWPLVMVPDLARGAPPDRRRVRFDAELGVALKLEGEAGEALVPGLFLVIKAREDARQADEARRLAYVALTRARDRIMLTSAAPAGGLLDVLVPGLANASVPIDPIVFDAEAALPPTLPEPVARPLEGRLLLGPVGPALGVLPVTSLSVYRKCPRAFRFEFVEGHPGLEVAPTGGSGGGRPADAAARIGTLTHLALERDLFDPATLAPFDPALPADAVVEAVALARVFHESPKFAAVCAQGGEREKGVSLKIGKLCFRGQIDLLGPDFVLDYKTDSHMEPEHHLFQLWAYAQAEGRSRVHLAYLRHEALLSFDGEDLARMGAVAERLVGRMAAGDFTATPSAGACAHCGFRDVCEAVVNVEEEG